eukprot:CAMPEP_0206496014 /NCGR_PEP_ID=MMETSP0324_2-20121206/49067_1 /ASSEMBLY_ACC=CAM_ASM_000836 /TAXON_ID=2866 /ORGANISM="Crypthecodinium cohnii, Strain Seligo" /LENGTH=58 /DNA_ID=CAMNT_0053980771 /DNA_START=74 /DNA_END=250 /DNA_ORIENTATION=-
MNRGITQYEKGEGFSGSKHGDCQVVKGTHRRQGQDHTQEMQRTSTGPIAQAGIVLFRK